MASRAWRGAKSWQDQVDEIAPTIVGGSLKHGGPDLGPTSLGRRLHDLIFLLVGKCPGSIRAWLTGATRSFKSFQQRIDLRFGESLAV
jgi:hypothetical protein